MFLSTPPTPYVFLPEFVARVFSLSWTQLNIFDSFSDIVACCTTGGLTNKQRFYRFGAEFVTLAGGVPRGGIPDVGCSGNVSMGPDSIWFGNTDSSPHYIVSDLVKLMEN